MLTQNLLASKKQLYITSVFRRLGIFRGTPPHILNLYKVVAVKKLFTLFIFLFFAVNFSHAVQPTQEATTKTSNVSPTTPTYTPPTPQAQKKQNCNTRKFSLHITSAVSTLELFERLARECGFGLTVADDYTLARLKAPLYSTKLTNVKLDELLKIFITKNNLFYIKDKKHLTIEGTRTKSFKLDYINSVREGTSVTKASTDQAPVQTGTSGTSTQVSTSAPASENAITVTEKLDFWSSLSTELKSLLSYKNASLIINQPAGLITVTSTPKDLVRVENYISNLQKRLKQQVLIEVAIISVDFSNDESRGVDWSKFDLSFTTLFNDATSRFSFGGTSSSLSRASGGGTFVVNGGSGLSVDGLLNFLSLSGYSKLISTPRVMTLNNQQALISVGEFVNYRISQESSTDSASTTKTSVTYNQYSQFVGILLNILPSISEDGSIMLRINPSISTFKYNEDRLKQSQIREIAPDTMQKKISSVVEVRSGDSVILGGLITKNHAIEESRVALMGSIPLLGWLFRSNKMVEKRSEVIFVITPYVIKNGRAVLAKQQEVDVKYPEFD